VKARVPTLRRHLTPGFVTCAYHLLRTRALISLSARVQWGSEITLGRGTVVKAFAVVQSSGGRITFGRDCAVSSFVHVSTGVGDVVVGDYVRIATHCALVGGAKEVRSRDILMKDQPEGEVRGLWIGDDVLIGAGTVVLAGSRIERGAVIGANSVVTGTIPEYAIAAGAPAKVVGYRQ
jgi:acetyltransferase-like isoleucine patch superfamily enzyme